MRQRRDTTPARRCTRDQFLRIGFVDATILLHAPDGAETLDQFLRIGFVDATALLRRARVRIWIADQFLRIGFVDATATSPPQRSMSCKLATRNVFRWLDRRGIEHSGRISGATLGSVLGIDGRMWRRIVAWHESELPPRERPGRPMKPAEWRLLVEVSGVDVGGQTEAA